MKNAQGKCNMITMRLSDGAEMVWISKGQANKESF